MSFDPEVGDKITLCGTAYTVEPRAAGLLRAYQQEGGKAIVYKLKKTTDGSFWAFKVFRYAFRGEHQAASVIRLAQVAGLPGLRAAHQQVIPASDACTQEFSEFAWAVLMPWIEGQTWADILDDVAQKKRTYTWAEAMAEAAALAKLFATLESNGHVHCDISSGNIMRLPGPTPRYELIDLEDMRIAGAVMPKNSTPGTPGYGLPGVYTTAVPAGDRYAASIVLLEALALSTPDAAALASSEGVFSANRENPKDQQRFENILFHINQLKPKLAGLFRQSWKAASLEACPKIDEYLALLEGRPQQTVTQTVSTSTFSNPPPKIGAANRVAPPPPPPTHGGGMGGSTNQPVPPITPIVQQAKQKTNVSQSGAQVKQPTAAPKPSPAKAEKNLTWMGWLAIICIVFGWKYPEMRTQAWVLGGLSFIAEIRNFTTA